MIVAIPAQHAIAFDRLAPHLPPDDDDIEVIVACAGQPHDRAAIHAHLRDAHFLLAPAETPAPELRRLAAKQATGDILTIVDGVAPASAVSPAERPVVSVVVPVRNGSELLEATFTALAGSSLARDACEIIVVDDSSTDGSATDAARYADVVVRLTGGSRGAAYARNRGAEVARSAVLLFVDAGVCVRRDTLVTLLTALDEDPGVVAAGAANDGTSGDGGVSTQYWNLLQQHGAAAAGERLIHFNVSCGAVRRAAFFDVGMFDEWHFRGSSIEELELGVRLLGTGHRVVLRADAGFASVRAHGGAGVLRRAATRSALITRLLGYRQTDVVARSHPVHTLGSENGIAAAAAAVSAMIATVWPSPVTVLVGATLVAGVVYANLGFLRFLARRRGLTFTVAAAPLHFAAQIAVAVGRAAGWILRNVIGSPGPDATTQAFAEVGVMMWPPVPRRP